MNSDKIISYVAHKHSASIALLSKSGESVNRVLEGIVKLRHGINDFRKTTDFVLLLDGEEIGLGEARAVHDFTLHRSTYPRTVIINNLTSVNDQAIAALLKIVEEHNVLFVIVAPSRNRRFRTILSRCQTFVLQPPRAINTPDAVVKAYVNILYGSGDTKRMSIVAGLYLCMHRVMCSALKMEMSELFSGEFSKLSSLNINFDDFIYKTSSVLDFAHKALAMRIDEDVLVVALSDMLFSNKAALQ